MSLIFPLVGLHLFMCFLVLLFLLLLWWWWGVPLLLLVLLVWHSFSLLDAVMHLNEKIVCLLVSEDGLPSVKP